MIEVENLSKEFKSYKKSPGFKGTVKSLFSKEVIYKKAVDNISFHIDEGEIVGYIGSNGAGKSTTIKMMSGILTPTSGKCMVNGIEPYKERQKNAKQIGVVFGQRTQLWWDLPLTETFSVLKEIYEVPEHKFKERMEFIYDVLGIKEFENNAVRTLSLGQRMRADLGAALLHNPKILYLDEPTIGLDVVVKDKIRAAIKEINNEFNTTVILTTHDLVDIEELCKKIIIIDNGKKIYDGNIENLKNKYGNRTNLEIEMETDIKAEALKLQEVFHLKPEDINVLRKDKALHIEFNKQVISVSKIAGYIMGLTEVEDMHIKETELTEIIKQIYTNGVN